MQSISVDPCDAELYLTTLRFLDRYENLESMFKALKDESQKSYLFLEEARSTMLSLKHAQASARDAFKGQYCVNLRHSDLMHDEPVIEPFLDKENGTYSKPAETKAIINEIRAENIRCESCLELLSSGAADMRTFRPAGGRSIARKAPHGVRRTCRSQDTGIRARSKPNHGRDRIETHCSKCRIVR
jgi:hypothetical protein